MTELEFHPFAAIWPLLEGDDLKVFTKNIKMRGQKLPILTYQGKVLDGRNRYRACIALGIEPKIEAADVKDDEDALELVVSLNDQRRHLEKPARAIAAGRLATMRHGGDRKSKGRFRPLTDYTTEEAAKKLGVGRTSVIHARTILEHGDADTIQAVEKGRLPLEATAEKLRAARKPKAEPTPPGQKTNAERRAEMMAKRAALFSGPSKQKVLTPEEVDPDFKGTRLEYLAEYGHGPSQTKAERDASRLRLRVDTLSNALRDFAKAMPVEVLSEDDVLAWFAMDGGGKNQAVREERLLTRFATVKAMMNDLLYPLFAKVESRMKGRPIEVQRAG